MSALAKMGTTATRQGVAVVAANQRVIAQAAKDAVIALIVLQTVVVCAAILGVAARGAPELMHPRAAIQRRSTGRSLGVQRVVARIPRDLDSLGRACGVDIARACQDDRLDIVDRRKLDRGPDGVKAIVGIFADRDCRRGPP
jgi:hypothetical protein